eukprot:10156335-Ditylum_brightwellii.AAC.1
MANLSLGHIEAETSVVRYMKGIKDNGISFCSNHCHGSLDAYAKFPIAQEVIGLCDANWGIQDTSAPKPDQQFNLKLFKSHSMPGFLIWYYSLINWVSKRQPNMVRLRAASEIYAIDECTKAI